MKQIALQYDYAEYDMDINYDSYSNSELTMDQVRYAAYDVIVLDKMYHQLACHNVISKHDMRNII